MKVKRLVSALLFFVMVLGMVPGSASASNAGWGMYEGGMVYAGETATIRCIGGPIYAMTNFIWYFTDAVATIRGVDSNGKEIYTCDIDGSNDISRVCCYGGEVYTITVISGSAEITYNVANTLSPEISISGRELNKYNYDLVRITNVTSDSTYCYADVEYNLVSRQQGVVKLGVPDGQDGLYRTSQDRAIVVNKGYGEYSFQIPKDELTAGKLYVCLSSYPDSDNTNPICTNTFEFDLRGDQSNDYVSQHDNYFRVPENPVFDIKEYKNYSLTGNEDYHISVGENVFITPSSGRTDVAVPSSFEGDIEISKAGFYTHHIPAEYVRIFNMIYMHREDETTPYIENLLMKRSNATIFSDAQRIELTFSELSKCYIDVYFTANWCGKKGVSIYFEQGPHKVEIKEGLNTRVDFGTNFDSSSGAIYLCLKTSQGEIYRYKTKIEPEKKNLDFSLDFGEAQSGVASDDMQGLAGEEFELKYALGDMIPVSCTVKADGTVEGAIGVSGKDEYKATWYDAIKESLKKSHEKTSIKKAIKNLKDSGGDVFSSQGSFAIGVKMEVIGYFTAHIVKESPNPSKIGTLEMDEMDVVVSVEGSASVSHQTFICFVPVYWKVELAAEIAFAFSSKRNELSKKLEVQMPGIEITIKASGNGCLGINKVIGTGISLSGELKITFCGPDYNFTTSTGKLSVSLSGVVQAFSFDGKYGNWDVIPEETLWDNSREEKTATHNLRLAMGEVSSYKLTNFTKSGAAFIDDVGQVVSDDGVYATKSIFTESTYSNSKVNVLQLNDDYSIAVWVGLADARSNINKPALMYSILDRETKSWSEPELVSDDGTADYYPVAKVSDGKMHLVWMNVAYAAENDTDIQTYTSLMGINYIEFDSRTLSFGEPVSVSVNDNKTSFLPDVFIRNSQVLIAWAEDSSNNLMASSNDNSICLSEFDGEQWDYREVASGLNNINSIALSATEAGTQIYYSCDTDGDYTTTDDLEIFVCGTSNQRLTDNNTIDSSVFSDGEDVYWYADSVLKNTSGEEIDLNIINDNYTLVSNDNGDKAVVYTGASAENGKTDIFVVYYTDSVWGKPIKVAETSNYVSSFGAYYDFDELVICVNECETIENSVSKSAICEYRLMSDIPLVISDLEYLPYSMVADNDADVYIDIQNSTNRNVSRLNFEVCDLQGETLVNTTTVMSICSGEQRKAMIHVPVIGSDSQFDMKITPVFSDGSVGSVVTKRFSFTPYDISVERFAAIYNEQDCCADVSVSVVNRGIQSGRSVHLDIFRGGMDGDLVYSEPIEYPELNTSENIEISLQDISLGDLLYVTVSTESEENLCHNNSEFAIVSPIYNGIDAEIETSDDVLYIDQAKECESNSETDTVLYFNPENAGYFQFVSQTNSSLNAVLYNVNGEIITDWNYSEGNGFDLRAQLSEDEAYMLKIHAPEGTTFEVLTHKLTEIIPTEPIVPAEGEKFKLATSLKEGDEVIIVCTAKNIAMGCEYEGYYNATIKVAPNNGVLVNSDPAIVWTVGKEGNFYTFSYGGKKIGLGSQYMSMQLDAEFHKWKIEPSATEGSFYIKNLDRDVTSSYYIQWYEPGTYWSCYNILNEERMALSFYVKDDSIPPTEQTEPTTPTQPSGDYVAIYFPKESKVMTTESYLYNNKKMELVAADATLSNGKVSTTATNVALFEMITDNGITTFKTADGKYLEADGTNVQLVSAENDNTKFVIEAANGGSYLKCANAQYQGKEQYIEFYSGYITVYSLDTSKADIYTFGFYPVDNGTVTPTEPTTPIHLHTWGNGMITKEAACTEAGVMTYNCTRCGETRTEEIAPLGHNFSNGSCRCGEQLKIHSAALRLSENIDMIYAAELPEGIENPYMVFTFLGKERTVDSYTVNDAGQYCFELLDINPQCMGDNISATLYATYDGTEYTDTVAEYSIREYCVNQLGKTDDEARITLLSDILTYGAAAQQYMGYKTDALVTDGLDLTPSTFEAISGKTVSFTGERDVNTDWTGAALVLSNDLAARFTFKAKDIEGLSVAVSINGRTQTFDTFEDAGNGKYFVTFDGIKATEFDDTVTARFYRNGEPLGAAVNYSVNTYICGTQNCDNANLQALVRALCNYGASAKAYAG